MQCLCHCMSLSKAQKEAACEIFVHRLCSRSATTTTTSSTTAHTPTTTGTASETPIFSWADELRSRLRVHAAFLGPILGALRSIPRDVPPVFRGDMHFIPALLRLRSRLGERMAPDTCFTQMSGLPAASARQTECAFTLRLDLAWDSSARLQAKLLFTDNAPVHLPPASSRLERCRARSVALKSAGWEVPTHCAARFAEFTRDFDLGDGEANADARLHAVAAELLAILFDTCNLRAHHKLEVMHFREWCSGAPDSRN